MGESSRGTGPGLEIVPRKKIEYKGALFEEMDVDAILAAQAPVALIDELAHTKHRSSKHRSDMKTYSNCWIGDRRALYDEHSASGERDPTVQGVTGIKCGKTVPDWVLQRVNEVVMIDLTPERCRTGMRRGDVYPQERVGRALENLFPAKPI